MKLKFLISGLFVFNSLFAATIHDTVLGSSSVAENSGTAIGYRTSAIGGGSIAIGHEATSEGPGALSIGAGANADGNQSIVIGLNSSVGSAALKAIAIGVGTNVNSTNGIGLGSSIFFYQAAQNSVAIGNNIIMKGANSVSFLNGSTEARSNVFNIGNRRLTNLLSPIDSTDAATKSYVDSMISSGSDLSNYYDKTASDARFASKTDTYTKAQVDDAITNGVSGIDLTGYELSTNVDSKVLTAKTEAINTSKTYTDTTATNTLSSSKSYVDTSLDAYYTKSAIDANYYTKTQTYSKSEIDSAISNGVGSIDLSNYYDKTTVDSGIEAASSTTLSSAKSYMDSSLSNYYDKTASDARFASKTDTYTKAQVDDAISSVGSIDLSAYETILSVDTKVASLKNEAIADSKIYADTTASTTLSSAKEYVDTGFYSKSYIDTNYYTKTQTYNKSEVDALVSGGPTADLSGFYSKTDVDNLFSHYYTSSQIDSKLSNYSSSASMHILINTAKAEAIQEAQNLATIAQNNAKEYTDQKVAEISGNTGTSSGVEKTYVDNNDAKTLSDANTYTDAKSQETLDASKAYTDSKINDVSVQITQAQADALGATTQTVSLTKESSVTGNVHGITIYDDKTIITGGTTSTQMTLNDDTVNFQHVQTGAAVRLTGVADGIDDTDAANVNQVNNARESAVEESNSYTDREISIAKKEASQGTALAIALATPMSFHNGNNAMNIGTGYYKGEKAVSLKIGRKLNDSTYYTLGVATAGRKATAVQAAMGWSW